MFVTKHVFYSLNDSRRGMHEMGPDVVSESRRYHGNYLMIPMRRPKEYSFAISFGINLYVVDIADDDVFRRQHCNPAYANTYLQSMHHITAGHFRCPTC